MLHPMCQQQFRSHKVLDAETQKRSGINHSIVLVFAVDSLHDNILGKRIIQHNLSIVDFVETRTT